MWDCWSSCGEEAGGGSRSFTEALREKYSSDNYPYCCPAVSAPWPVPDSLHREWLIVPPILGLSGCGVAWAGQQVGIKEFCNHVTELDISHNILNDWHEVSSIVRHIPQLDFLNLSGNPFGQSPITSVNFPQMLRRLVLNNTDADWTTVRTLLHSLPRLEELFLCFNNYKEVPLHPTLAYSSSSASSSSTSSSSSSSNPTHSQSTLDSFHSWQSSVPSGSQSGGTQSLDTKHSKHTDGAGLEFQCTAALEHAGAQSVNISDPNTSSPVHSDLLQNEHLVSDVSVQDPNTAICSFVNIKLLHITYNHLAAWDEICHLGLLFPCLERLVLANNPLQGISGYKEKLAKTFPRLQYLNLQNTALGEWSDIERLTALPALTDLRLLGIPLLKAHSATERRKLSIARLPCVRSLNGSWIFPEEREDAERFFLRHYMDMDPALLPPRYFELLAHYGQLQQLADIDLRPQEHAEVSVRCDDKVSSCFVRLNQTVTELRRELRTVCTLPPGALRLFHVVREDNMIWHPEEMRVGTRQLHSFGIRDGDEILVQRKGK
uniref:tubulin-specific chaperone cofactor E-like protein isoform X2 n=1 Tax=Myxine glutinosa TaxID=7769 RepID=UPI00358EC987